MAFNQKSSSGWGKTRFFAMICLMLSIGYTYIRLSSDNVRYSAPAPAQEKKIQAEAPKVNAFMGRTGYLLELPPDYEAYPAVQGNTELVFFFPKGGSPTMDESRYAELKLVRMEVLPDSVDGQRIPMEMMKKGVQITLEGRKETFSFTDVPLGGEAFQVNITAPKKIKQLFMRGNGVIYQFTAADEEFMRYLAAGIKEPGAARPPGAK